MRWARSRNESRSLRRVTASRKRETGRDWLLRLLQRTWREIGPFKLSRIALFGFSALASASPNCASADDEVARGKYMVENLEPGGVGAG
jgi:hypothetical protein